MLAYATATYEKVISCILCSPLALYIHPVEFVTVSPAFPNAPAFLLCLNTLHFKASLKFPCKSKSVTLKSSEILPTDVR